MKRYTHILVLLILSGSLFGQDQQVLSTQDIDGTARYVGLCGAMCAVGGDPTAANDNPAGLGIYRRQEVLLSFGYLGAYTHQQGQPREKVTSDGTLNNLSWVLSFGSDHRPRKLKHSNIMVSYNRRRTFDTELVGSSDQMPSTLPTLIAQKTDGLPANVLTPSERWNNSNIGWLSILGYDAYLIDPKSDGSTNWTPCIDTIRSVNSTLTLEESGFVNDWNLSWGGNFNHKLYFGATLSISNFGYIKNYTYSERKGDKYYAKLSSYLSINCVGIHSCLGLMYQPLRWMRIGLSIQSPTTASIKVTTDGDLQSDYSLTSVHSEHVYSPTDGPTTYTNYSFPYQLKAGLAFFIKDKGMVSLEYDYEDWKQMSHIHTTKIGLEYVFHRYLFFDVGAAYEFDGLKDKPTYVFSETTSRTDPDYRNLHYRYYVSTSIGYRGKYFVGQIAYQYKHQKEDIYANELQRDAYVMHTDTHRLVFTLGWHSKAN